ncbi:hypothetical protein HK096_006907 [Nowakowskiella sp. JEL0078]|nr:hypothetical protein HK096_006907 [Nowakowskiella sp. JEL0078]
MISFQFGFPPHNLKTSCKDYSKDSKSASADPKLKRGRRNSQPPSLPRDSASLKKPKDSSSFDIEISEYIIVPHVSSEKADSPLRDSASYSLEALSLELLSLRKIQRELSPPLTTRNRQRESSVRHLVLMNNLVSRVRLLHALHCKDVTIRTRP